jgi:purine-binding chemotaxis protein CheW
MNKKLVIFSLDRQQFALGLSAVDRTIPVVEITPLPKAPEIILGIINIHGQIIPVFNIRKRFRLPDREMRLKDQFIIANTARYKVALLVDEVTDIIEYAPQEMTEPGTILPVTEYVEGIIKLEGNMVLIHSLDKFLSLDEEMVLENTLKEVQKEKMEFQ